MSLLQTLIGILLIQLHTTHAAKHHHEFIASSTKKQESILFSCFINNQETQVTIHEDKPKHFEDDHHVHTLHNKLSLSISTFPCYHFAHLNFTFSLDLSPKLYHKDGGFKTYKNGKLENKKGFKQNYRSYQGDVIISEYMDTSSSSSSSLSTGKASLTFMGDISVFNQEDQSADHASLYKCQSFSAQIWTQQYLYEIKPIPSSSVSSPKCDTMTISAIPTHKLSEFSNIPFLNGLLSSSNTKRKLMDSDGIINKLDCGETKFPHQWQHHHSIKIGLVIDEGFYAKFDHSDDELDAYIAMMFTNINGLFYAQLNVHIAIGDVLVAEDVPNYADSTEWWMDSPPKGLKLGVGVCTCAMSAKKNKKKRFRIWWL